MHAGGEDLDRAWLFLDALLRPFHRRPRGGFDETLWLDPDAVTTCRKQLVPLPFPVANKDNNTGSGGSRPWVVWADGVRPVMASWKRTDAISAAQQGLLRISSALLKRLAAIALDGGGSAKVHSDDDAAAAPTTASFDAFVLRAAADMAPNFLHEHEKSAADREHTGKQPASPSSVLWEWIRFELRDWQHYDLSLDESSSTMLGASSRSSDMTWPVPRQVCITKRKHPCRIGVDCICPRDECAVLISAP